MSTTAGRTAPRTGTGIEDLKQKPSEYRHFLSNSHVVVPGKNKGSTIIAVKDPGLQSAVSPYEPIFQALPEQIIFKGYKPFETYEAHLVFQNKDKVARTVSVAPCESTIFAIPSATSKPRKTAAGMKTEFVVKFTPTSTDDFHYDVVVDTDRETFVVPLRTIGARGVLDMPDQLVFGSTPVRVASTKPLHVRNVGTRRAHFTLSTDSEPQFSVSPRVGTLEPDASTQISVTFNPERLGSFEAALRLEYDTGEVVYTKLSGGSEQVNVFLEGDTLEMQPTYTSLSSSRRIKLHNASDCLLSYSWRAFGTDADDSLATAALDASADGQYYGTKRELEAAKKQQDSSRLAFHDDFFQISPAEGKLWPQGTSEAIVTFSPNNESLFSANAFLDVQGRQARLPLQLRGIGLGPKLAFSPETIEAGTLPVSADHQFEMTVTNVGDIEADFQLAPYTSAQQAYVTVRPSAGVLGSGDSMTLQLTFSPRSLGEMLIPLEWQLRGSTVLRPVYVHANVIGPTLSASVSELDYGLVSFGFPATCALRLTNTSDLPLVYALRVPRDEGAPEGAAEFAIEPDCGAIGAYGVQDVRVHLTPKTVGSFAGTSLLVDVECVGTVLALPVLAESRIPTITTASSVLDFGEVFVDTAYSRSIVLQNDTDLLARYQQLEPEPAATDRVAFHLEPTHGHIDKYCNKSIKVSFTPKCPGPIHTMLRLRIVGSSQPPLEITLNAHANGPLISLNTNELNFGKIPVLTKVIKSLRLTNESPVPAPFKVGVPTGADACFFAEVSSGVVPPLQSITLKITALVNDTVAFSSRLTIETPTGHQLAVTLRAYGEGNCIVASEPINKIDFGSRPTNSACVREFTLTNRGRRGQVVTWTSDKAKKNRKLMNNEKQLEIFFSITPERVDLPPGASATFTVRGLSTKPQAVAEKFVCTGVAEIVSVVLFDSDVLCCFDNPLLEFPSSLSFTWNYEHGLALAAQSQPLVLRNVSAFALSFVLRPHSPFSVTPRLEHTLQPGELVELEAHFQPNGLRHEQLSGKTQSHVSIVYRDHPQKDVIQLLGVLNFPNLTFQPGAIDFGCVQRLTDRRVPLLMKNDGIINVEYSWSFLSDEETDGEVAAEEFDVLPIRGRLAPGQSQLTEFVFYARHERKTHAVACCSVVGGPQYEVPLVAEASSIVQYRLDRRLLDFGMVPYDSSVSQPLSLSNTGKSVLRYSIDTSRSAGRIQVQPSQGQIVAGATQTLSVTLTPGVPDKIDAQACAAVLMLPVCGLP
eukprot:TRINITY_DN2221_c1_g1_i5.p1 TRINITY_DN2221_c1_g1~~TRINITY_DN2221_c1_g1_i5.p1  ORF type:complete len:1262 (+),score=576.09 TRINITY_DN2221_c1_g1_i5:84-3869(+)